MKDTPARCLGRKALGVRVFYRPHDGYTGKRRARFTAQFPKSQMTLDVDVTITNGQPAIKTAPADAGVPARTNYSANAGSAARLRRAGVLTPDTPAQLGLVIINPAHQIVRLWRQGGVPDGPYVADDPIADISWRCVGCTLKLGRGPRTNFGKCRDSPGMPVSLIEIGHTTI